MTEKTLEEYKYQCPACKEGFDESGRNDDDKVCCPHCEVLLVYHPGMRGDDIRTKSYRLREEYFTYPSRLTNYVQTSKEGEIPVVWKRDTVHEKKFYDEPDYVVFFQDIITETLTCPECGGLTTSNNYVSGSYTVLCENSVYNERKDKHYRCKTWIEYRFRRNRGIVKL